MELIADRVIENKTSNGVNFVTVIFSLYDKASNCGATAYINAEDPTVKRPLSAIFWWSAALVGYSRPAYYI